MVVLSRLYIEGREHHEEKNRYHVNVDGLQENLVDAGVMQVTPGKTITYAGLTGKA